MMNYRRLFKKYIDKQKGSGNQIRGLCPFHDDSSASFSCNLESGLWKCHAGCGSGDAADFAKKMDLDPKPFYRGERNESANSKNCDPDSTNNELSKNDKVIAYDNHHYLLKNFKQLVGDLPWTVEVVKKTFTGYDPKTERFTFLHTDENGKAVNIKWHKTKSGEQPFSISGHGQCRLYPMHLLKDYNPKLPLIYCEGEPDCNTLLSQGLQPVTSTTGAESIPNLSGIEKFKEIVIVFDNDEAVISGASKLAGKIKATFPNVKIHVHEWKDKPNKYDVTDFIIDGGNAESFGELIEPGFPEFRVFPDFGVTQCRIDYSKLTPGLKQIIEEANKVSDSPDEFIISSFLAIWAGVVGREIVGPSGLQPNINTILFAPSGIIRKSAGIEIVEKLFIKNQDKLDQEYENEMQKYHIKIIKWKKNDEKGSEPRKPNRRILFVPIDFTEAAFIHLMKRNRLAGVIVSTEYSDFHKKLHRDTTGMAEAMLSAYDGKKMQRLTISRGLEIFNNPAFSILGATTLGGFSRAFGSTERENGSLARLLPVVITQRSKKRMNFLYRECLEESIIEKIYKKSLQWIPNSNPKKWQTRRIYFDDNLKIEFTEWENSFIKYAESFGIGELMSVAERMVPSAIKLTMLLDSFEIPDVTKVGNIAVTQNSLQCAIMLIENVHFPSMLYLLQNQVIPNPNINKCQKILDTISNAGGIITRSDLLKKCGFKKIDMDRYIDQLIINGKISVRKEYQKRHQSGGQSKTYYFLESYPHQPKNSENSENSETKIQG